MPQLLECEEQIEEQIAEVGKEEMVLKLSTARESHVTIRPESGSQSELKLHTVVIHDTRVLSCQDFCFGLSQYTVSTHTVRVLLYNNQISEQIAEVN